MFPTLEPNVMADYVFDASRAKLRVRILDQSCAPGPSRRGVGVHSDIDVVAFWKKPAITKLDDTEIECHRRRTHHGYNRFDRKAVSDVTKCGQEPTHYTVCTVGPDQMCGVECAHGGVYRDAVASFEDGIDVRHGLQLGAAFQRALQAEVVELRAHGHGAGRVIAV